MNILKLISPVILAFAINNMSLAQNSTGMPAGNIGIGTASPQALLDLGPGNGVKSLFYGSGGNTGYYWGTGVNLGQSPNEASIFIGGAAGTCCGAENFAIVSANQSSWPFSSYTTRFVVSSNSGYVGIGTTSPARLLDLQGTGNWQGSGGVRLRGNNPGIEITDGPSGQGWLISNGVVTSNDGSLGLAYNINAGTHNIVVTNTGNVGIGTYLPGSYKLAVEGILGARKVIVTQASWADYVFDSSYVLPALSRIEQFIKIRKHLPGVPSAKEVAEKGLDIGDNQARLLQKIEELTLYAIEQQKEIANLKEENKKMSDLQNQINELKTLLKK